jgi:hypothetical protein
MYVSRDKASAIVFAYSTNSDHWNNLVPRLHLRGLLPDAEYEVTEPFPNDIAQSAGNFMLIESGGPSSILVLLLSNLLLVPVYQLGVSTVALTGDILMNAGLPGKCCRQT